MISLLVMTDGRQEYLTRTLASAEVNLKGEVTRAVIHDDSGDPNFHQWLEEYYCDYEVVPSDRRGHYEPASASTLGPRLGYSGAVQRAWKYLEGDENRFTFHLEDDFVFNRPIDLDELARFLDSEPWLAQIALRRGRWGREREGFVEDTPSAYCELHDHRQWDWIEHRLYYTMTPHLYRSRLREVGWPDGEGSEIHFKDKLLSVGLPWGVRGDYVKFAFWGNVENGADAVTHIGEERRGFGH